MGETIKSREHLRTSLKKTGSTKKTVLTFDVIESSRIESPQEKKYQLFLSIQFQGNLYEQVEGVAVGSPLGTLVANTLMYDIRKQLETENKMATMSMILVMPDIETALEFLTTCIK